MEKKVLHSVFEEVVKSNPSAIAVEAGDSEITYGNLNAYANRVAHLLRSVECTEGVIAAVITPSSVQMVASVLAVFRPVPFIFLSIFLFLKKD
jgi:non-ribosomal peptide synthetase component F